MELYLPCLKRFEHIFNSTHVLQLVKKYMIGLKVNQINIEISFKTKQTITLDSTCFRPNLIF